MTNKASRVMRAAMRRVAAILFATMSVAATPALAQGQIGTIARGTYQCELPGDATGTVGIPRPQESFIIESASRYTSPQGDGTYLRRGNQVRMTSGPRNGDRYEIVSSGYLRKIEDGGPGRLRCVRQGR